MTAHAEWKPFGGTDNYDAYIDYSRIKTEGRHKSIWDLADFKSSQTNSLGKQYKSSIRKNLIDCQASRSQTVARFDYPEQMGSGALVSSANFQLLESNWENFPPNSIGDGLINIACGRK
jgi:hypothetical protein